MCSILFIKHDSRTRAYAIIYQQTTLSLVLSHSHRYHYNYKERATYFFLPHQQVKPQASTSYPSIALAKNYFSKYFEQLGNRFASQSGSLDNRSRMLAFMVSQQELCRAASSDIVRASSSTLGLLDAMFELLLLALAGLIAVLWKACRTPSEISEGTSDDGLVSTISLRLLDDMPEMYASEYGPCGI